uniref:Pirin N-terminal domain-containing protein n=1 Tax=Triticum urartu TaxID=4572 RepID=A0A8R7Q8X1_TRIUA
MSSSSSSVSFQTLRKVVKKVLSLSQSEGEGATVRRSIGGCELRNLDPFLLLDEFSVSKPAGFPDHPHRGFETVTYMLDGAFTQQDFSGHKGTIRTGDVQVRSTHPILQTNHLTHSIFDLRTNNASECSVPQQWMTAGRGIVHSEMPAADGVQKGLQLWINLASKDK